MQAVRYKEGNICVPVLGVGRGGGVGQSRLVASHFIVGKYTLREPGFVLSSEFKATLPQVQGHFSKKTETKLYGYFLKLDEEAHINVSVPCP